jgi:hypothetical protein
MTKNGSPELAGLEGHESEGAGGDEIALVRAKEARPEALAPGRPERATQEVAMLLCAQLKAFEGLVEESRRLLGELEEAAGRARALERPRGAVLPSEEVLEAMVELACRRASEEEWDALVVRSERESVEQASIELLEARALSARRAGKTEEARRCQELVFQLSLGLPQALQRQREKRRELSRN